MPPSRHHVTMVRVWPTQPQPPRQRFLHCEPVHRTLPVPPSLVVPQATVGLRFPLPAWGECLSPLQWTPTSNQSLYSPGMPFGFQVRAHWQAPLFTFFLHGNSLFIGGPAQECCHTLHVSIQYRQCVPSPMGLSKVEVLSLSPALLFFPCYLKMDISLHAQSNNAAGLMAFPCTSCRYFRAVIHFALQMVQCNLAYCQPHS
jgi:hypothetical protein